MDKNTMIAIEKFLDDEKYGVTTNIAGFPSYGYGILDSNGFWEFQIPEWMIEMPKQKQEYEFMLKLYDGLIKRKLRLCPMEKFSFSCSGCSDCDNQDNYCLCWNQYFSTRLKTNSYRILEEMLMEYLCKD